MRHFTTIRVPTRIAILAAVATLLAVCPASVYASGDGGGGGHALDPTVLIGVAAMLVAAKLAGELFERMGQPAVLGELVGGCCSATSRSPASARSSR